MDFKKTLVYFTFILFGIFCNQKNEIFLNSSFSEKDSELPSLPTIKKILLIPQVRSSLTQKATQLGYSSMVDWYGNTFQKISEHELDLYYNIHKPKNSLQDTEFISQIRKEIHERIAWKKIFQEAKIDYLSYANEQTHSELYVNSENPKFLGSKTAKVQIFEFSDFACYYCSKSQLVKKKLIAKYGSQIQWHFKNFPIVENHSEAFLAHIALGCVEKVAPKKYWDYYFKLFENFRNLSPESLLEYTKQTQISVENWKTCMNNKTEKEKIIAKIEQDIQEGRMAGVSGTPSFIINGKLYVGSMPFSAFKDIIQKELKK